ncbi:MAG: SDR family NAD(P)-dependent oxidoreductase [Myxococcales bacterium]|nr:SDR family NAD(P)-dependent oxidoreductase [Myxococcales bacterium]
MSKPVCAVVGVGPGNGAAFARRFNDEGYAVALLARGTTYSEELAASLDGAIAYGCDVTNGEAVASTFKSITRDLGDVEVLLYNAGSGVFGSIEELDGQAFENAWRVNTLGAVHCAKQVIPAMKARGEGNIVFTGATASLRGGARFAAFASAKASQRNLAQSMARHLGPAGIHVSLVIVDGVIDLPRTRAMMADKSDDHFLAPDDIADVVYHLTQQNKSAWTFELDVRPFGESW